MVRGLLLAAVFACLAGIAQAKTLRSDAAMADGVRLEISAEVPDGGLLVQEMAVVTISADFRDPLNLFDLETAIFPNARALQLGRDSWTLEGVSALSLKRRIAVFPQKSGAIAIGPFRLDATLTTPEGGRREVRLDTPLLTVPVTAAPKEVSGWWLPVRNLSVKDEWDPDPQDIPADGLAHRTVTVEALGAMAEQLPPVPLLRSPPIVTFALPETRETLVTPEGPLGRAVYRWDVRAAHDEPALLDGVTIPWFDTAARAMAEARIPERRIAERLLLVKEESDAVTRLLSILDWRAIALGGGLGAAIFLLIAWRNRRHPDADALRALARAASRRNPQAVSRLVSTFVMDAPLDRSGEAASLVSALDRHLHSAAAFPCPDLKRLSRCVRRELTARVKHRPDRSPSALLPLDAGGPA